MTRRAAFDMRLVRRGSLTALVLFAMLVLLGVIALALSLGQLAEAKASLQTSVDSAALAAALELVDERLLTDDPEPVAQTILVSARARAIAYARANPVAGEPLVLQDNPQNLEQGDILFGTLDHPRDPTFQRAESPYLHVTNAVRIRGQRTRARGNPLRLWWGAFVLMPTRNALAVSTAMLDHDVLGIRPQTSAAVPLMPIALVSDRTLLNTRAWEYQSQFGGDLYAFDRATHTFAPGADGLREVEVLIPLQGTSAPSEAVFLQLAAMQWSDVSRQIGSGVTQQDLADYGAQFVLRSDLTLPVVATAHGPAQGSSELSLVQQALDQVAARAEPRVWPLFVSYTADPAQPGIGDENGTAIVTGFVAARIVHVQTQDDGHGNHYLRLVLQPTMLGLSTLVTDSQYRLQQGADTWNRYLAKLRLVE
ncbi:MAG: hypothetical protein C4297_01220 [Gemmataceae bacterium]